MAVPDFWDDNDKAQAVIAEMNAVKSSVDSYEQLRQEYEDAGMMAELADEEGDETLAGEIENSIRSLLSKLEEFELQLLLNQPYDKLNAILELHPGGRRNRVAGLGSNAATDVYTLGRKTRL